MASLDNIRDTLKIVESQDINYVMVTLQKEGSKPNEFLSHSFHCITDEYLPIMIQVMQGKLEELQGRAVEISAPVPKKKKKF